MVLPKKILVVEDEILVALAHVELLRYWGYGVGEAAVSYAEALALADADPPDLALVDIRIRGLPDGIATAQALRQRAGCKIIFVTGQADPMTRARAEAILPDGYLVKPVSPQQLRNALEKALA